MDPSRIANGLEEHAPGHWRASAAHEVSYPESGHQRCLAVEETSFWFLHRASCVVAAIERFPPGGTLFDVGGGNGQVALALSRAGFPTALVEPGPAGAGAAYRRGVRPVIQATTSTAGFRPGVLPAVGMFDVLEHIEDDLGYLRALRSLMVPGGRLYLTVPAYPWLWSADDVRAGHHRRYTLRRLRSVVEGAGFTTEYATYLFRFLPLPVLLLRSLPSRIGRRSVETSGTGHHRVPPGALGRLLRWTLAREQSAVARRRTMRFGGSILLVGRGN